MGRLGNHAVGAAWNENDLVLKAGSYHSGTGVLSKPLTIKADGGAATITP